MLPAEVGEPFGWAKQRDMGCKSSPHMIGNQNRRTIWQAWKIGTVEFGMVKMRRIVSDRRLLRKECARFEELIDDRGKFQFAPIHPGNTNKRNGILGEAGVV